MNPPLLFLCHRIPYPPNKGDKIRSYHLLRYLLEHYRVYLGAFIDDEADWDHVQRLEGWCEECCFIGLNPRTARIASLRGLLLGQPLTLPYYANDRLRAWVGKTVRDKDIQRLLVYSSAMAQFILAPAYEPMRRVIDFVDIDSDKWRQYAGRKSWPLNWIYRREARHLLRFERDIASRFDASLFVSNAEARLFRQLASRSADRIGYYNNGVDTDYFSPDNVSASPYGEGERALVFTGAMDYWPNEDAVAWFARDVFPRILRQYPDARFYIVGIRPTEAVQGLEALPGVRVTGAVPDVRPYLMHATAAVAPMRVARGVQNKVLEAMAMARPVLVSTPGLEGINAEAGTEVLVADTAEEFIEQIGKVFEQQTEGLGAAARARVCRDFSWDDNLPRVGELLETGLTASPDAN
ncbi:MAG TPA: TIGR03087 family PEP-CTERM/XrtA system glycosyltransferase [Sedimenticola sp.]|nr:TIGR03087 family PEP-CTERM/XrtA system glycosyltransferase [Sedimenticola sp.]